MAGSDERPVSSAVMYSVISSKHSSMLSKPELDPKRAKCGVQTWAGINMQSGDASMTILRSSLASMPSMGRPSCLMFPILSRA